MKLKSRKEKKNNLKDRDAIKWIFNVAKGSWLSIGMYALLSAGLAYFGVLTTYGSKDIVNGAANQDLALLKRGALILLSLVLIQIVLKIAGNNLYERARAKIEIKIRTRIFNSIMHKDYSRLSMHHSGDLLNRLTNDVQTICNGVTGMIPGLVTLVTKLISSVVILITIDPFFAIIFLVGGILIAGVARFFRNYFKDIHKQVQEADGKVRSFFQECISNVLVVKVFNAYQQVAEKAKVLQENNYRIRIKRATISIFANSGMQMAYSLGYLFAMCLGGYRVYQGALDIGEMTAILQLVSQIQSPLSALAGVLPQLYGIIASAERIMEIENYGNELDIHHDIGDVGAYYAQLKSIDFEHVTFRYDRDVVLDDADVSIKKGDFAAVTGISGIGKSTLLKLILGVIYPTEGEIKIITEEETRIADKDTRNLFSYVPQGNMLLSGTLRENITFMCQDKSDEEIYEALRLSCADEFVSQLPDGLETTVGERGLGLSEGQIQRIAIARALLHGAPILLLDEATSALDEQTEHDLLKNLRQLHNKTCIIVTHKPAALKVCNKDIRIENGKISITDTTEVCWHEN